MGIGVMEISGGKNKGNRGGEENAEAAAENYYSNSMFGIFHPCSSAFSSDFGELPSGLSLRVEDSRAVAKNVFSYASNSLRTIPTRTSFVGCGRIVIGQSVS